TRSAGIECRLDRTRNARPRRPRRRTDRLRRITMAVVEDVMTSTKSSAPPAAAPRQESSKLVSRTVRLLGASWRPALVLLAVLAVWWFVAWREMVPAYLVPAPQAVLTTLWEDRALLAEHTWVTTQETIIG